jgi:hypothetical protein
VRLLSFPNSLSAEMSVSFSLLTLGMEWNIIQREGKGGQFTQFPQFSQCRDVIEFLIVKTRNGVEFFLYK